MNERVEMSDIEGAMHRAQAAINANHWAVTLGLKPFRDGNQWCLLWGDNIQTGVCGFGDTPVNAIYDFETAMHSRIVPAPTD